MQSSLSSLQLSSKSPISKQQYKKLKNILQSLLASNDSIEFRSPVDWKGLNLIDYTQIIKNPMDLGTVSEKLDNPNSPYYFVEDVLDHIQLIWDNCKRYNPPTSWIYGLADKLQRSFKKMVKNYLPNISITIPGRSNPQPPVLQAKKASTAPPSALQQSQSLQKQQCPTVQDKQKLADKFKSLSPTQLGQIVQHVMNKYPIMIKDNGDNAELILDALEWETYQELDNMADGNVKDVIAKKIKQ